MSQVSPKKIFEAIRRELPPLYEARARSMLIGPASVIDVVADPIVVTIEQRGSWSAFPPAPVNISLNLAGVADPILVTVSVHGTWLNFGHIADPIVVIISQHGDDVLGNLWSGLISITVTIGAGQDLSGADLPSVPVMITAPPKSNWVKWSNIGHLDFTIWRDNIAGERPVDWKGWIYAIKKLESKVVVYGQNGVSILSPVGNVYGLQTIHPIGLRGKQAVCGSEFEHFFVDKNGRLFRHADKLDRLDYSEYLNTLAASVVLSYDIENGLVYICDGTSGYVYSITDKSLGKGPGNVTGVGSQDGTLLVTSPAAIVIPTFELCTDIYDLGSRKYKTLKSIEIGTDETLDLWATVDFRLDRREDFTTLAWRKVNPSGIAYIPCFGTEFRFRLKMLTYAYFELDYIKVNGVIHGYSYLDSYNRTESA